MNPKKRLEATINYLKKKKKVLLLTTSNSHDRGKEDAKSTLLANKIASRLDNVTIIDVSRLNIYPCEGNVSLRVGNFCGEKEATLKDKTKNPSGCHRCWRSFDHKDDELWKISKELLESDAVVFFVSVRWGQTNSIYQKLIERLTWLENRHSTLKEDNLLKNIDVGFILVGQNWNGANVLKTQKKVLDFFGFHVVNDLFWNWQYTKNVNDESKKSYKSLILSSKKILGFNLTF